MADLSRYHYQLAFAVLHHQIGVACISIVVARRRDTAHVKHKPHRLIGTAGHNHRSSSIRRGVKLKNARIAKQSGCSACMQKDDVLRLFKLALSNKINQASHTFA